MIRDLRRRYFTVRYNYGSPILQQRAVTLLLINWTVLIIFSLVIFSFTMTRLLFGERDLAKLFTPLDVVTLIVVVVNYHLIQRGRLQIALWLFIAFLMVQILPLLVTSPDRSYLLAVAPLLIAAGLLLQGRGLLVVGAVVIVALVVRFNLQGQTETVVVYDAEAIQTEAIVIISTVAISTLFLLVFSGVPERVANESLTDNDRFRAVGEYGEMLNTETGDPEILKPALELVQNRLGYELAQFYLLDDAGAFSNRLRVGFEGQIRRMEVSADDPVIGEVVRTRQTVIVGGRDEGQRGEHLVPPSRQSISFPLLERDTVIAILDVQDKRDTPFSANEIAALRALAQDVEREYVYARTLRDLQSVVREQEGAINRFRSQMTELQGRSQGISSMGWARYFEGRERGFGFDLVSEGGKLTPISADEFPDAIRETLLRGEVAVDQQDGVQVVRVPIVFRDLILGAMAFNVPAHRPITERQLDMARAVSERLGVALENARLFEQTQAQATRERQASEISNLLLTAPNVEAVLSLAAERFNEALGAVHTRVYLEPGALVRSGEPS
jgi:GAF domain-containing protein